MSQSSSTPRLFWEHRRPLGLSCSRQRRNVGLLLPVILTPDHALPWMSQSSRTAASLPLICTPMYFPSEMVHPFRVTFDVPVMRTPLLAFLNTSHFSSVARDEKPSQKPAASPSWTLQRR